LIIGHQEKVVEASFVLDLKAFVPAKDHDLAKQFYVDLGFKLNWGNEQVAELEIGAFRFLLQNFHVQQFAENFMMHLMVDDADDWWKRIEDVGLKAKYPGITVKPPTLQPWGLRVLYLTDPSGVLWHIADRRSA
jgi:catechol 2,3-dioxygenase-like lactoylglutathione lyase family enzyme